MKFFKVLWDYLKFLFFIFVLAVFLLIGIIFVIIIFKGKIYIEVLIIFILIYMFLFWKIWLSVSRKKLLRNYKPEDDKARQGEIRRGTEEAGRVKATTPAIRNTDASVSRPEQLERREFLPKTTADTTRKNRKGIRKFLRRR